MSLDESKDRPLFSVITVTLNSAERLAETMSSVKAQEHRNFEYIVVDGDSSDGTQDMLRNKDAVVDVLVSEPDEGVYHAMNKAISLARGEYLYFLNAGDVFLHEKVLSIVAASLLESKADLFVGSGIRCSKETGNLIFLAYGGEEFNLEFFRKRTINHQCLFAHRDLFDNRIFDTRYQMLADYHWLITQLIVDRASVEYRNIGIVRYLNEGFSNNNYELFLAEKKQILEEFSSFDQCVSEEANTHVGKSSLWKKIARYFLRIRA